MKYLPTIVGFGGYGPAGRSSFNQAYQRTIFESLNLEDQQAVILSLATMMQLVRYDGELFIDADEQRLSASEVAEKFRDAVLSGTLIRELDEVVADVPVAGQLPTGFEPSRYYRSKYHPKGLQLAVLAASDAIRSMGIAWSEITAQLDPSQIAVYASSLMSQLDQDGFGNMMQASIKGERVSAKNLPLGLNSMPADFINAYVLGNVGKTGGSIGACATFLFNLEKAVTDIQTGSVKVAIVGASEAPITPEIIEGYAAMSALATTKKIKAHSDDGNVDLRKASRPFGNNSGFIIAESAQYIVLMADDFAIKMGAQIHASVPNVFVCADGYKKSISSPGPGNYVTLAKAVADAKRVLGDTSVEQASFVHAHGSSTPQNRTTESKILDKVAAAMNIQDWPITAVKAYMGHSLAPASGDQIINALGTFAHNIVPGIKTVDEIASDVNQGHLDFKIHDCPAVLDVAFINSKGFGGNNATAYLASPDKTISLIKDNYSENELQAYQEKLQQTLEAAAEYQQEAQLGKIAAIYETDDSPLTDDDIKIEDGYISFGGKYAPIKL